MYVFLNAYTNENVFEILDFDVEFFKITVKLLHSYIYRCYKIKHDRYVT